jgi:4-diphosphocytidyl-2-C-methyl-D-erythritol kinase
MVSVAAPAKINLFLHVGERRDDGFHELKSLVAFTQAADRLELAPADELSVQISGPFAKNLSSGDDNLVLRAARVLTDRNGKAAQGAAIRLEKNLPVAAGLGSGSADAGAALRGLNALWRLDLPERELVEIAASIGSDVPACVLSRPCWMEGRGERVADGTVLSPVDAVLVNPGIALRTANVFAALNARRGVGQMTKPPASFANLWDVVAYLGDAGNDLEEPACRLAPVIEDVLGALDHEPGCVMAQMSGSGATCFGLFDDPRLAQGAAERIAHDHREWWVRVTRIAPPNIGAPHWTA